MSVLRPITASEYDAWLEMVVPGYAEDKVSSGQWAEEAALDLSRKEYAELLPRGKDTENSYIYTVVSAEGEPLGRRRPGS